MKKLRIGLIILVLLLAVAGMAIAEETIALNTPVSAGVYTPDDATIFQYTPETSGIYEFSALREGDYYWGATGYILDADRMKIAEAAIYREHDGFSVYAVLSAGKTYYFATTYSEADGWYERQGTFQVQLTRKENIYARAKLDIVYSKLNQRGTVAVDAWSVNGGLTYQWYDGSTKISGATKASYTYPALTAPKTYRCVIKDAANKTTEVTVTARIDTEVSFSNNVSIGEYGGSATLETNATAAYKPEDLTYQWYREGYAGENWAITELTGETSPTLNLTNLTKSAWYYCEITDTYGNGTSDWISVDVAGDITASTESTSFITPVQGDSVTMSVTAQTPDDCMPITYRWVESYNGYQNDIEGATDSSYTVEHANSSRTYICYVSNNRGNERTLYFYVNPRSSFHAESGTEDENPENEWTTDVYITPGETAALNVDATASSNATLSYQWSRWNNVIGRYINIPSATGKTCQISRPGDYQCYVRDSFGYYGRVYYEVHAEDGFSVEADCETELALAPGTTANLKVTATGTGLKYRWYRGETIHTDEYYYSTKLIEGETGNTLPITVDGRCEYICTVSDTNGNAGSIYFYVTADNEFTAAAEQTEFAVAPGNPVTLSVNAQCTSGQLYYEWGFRDGVRMSYKTLHDVTGDTLTIDHIGADNWGEYMVMVSDDYGNSRVISFQVRVENHFTAAAVGNTELWIKPGGSVILAVEANCDEEGTINYQWYHNAIGSPSYKAISGATGSSYSPDPANCYRSYYCHVSDGYGNSKDIYYWIYIDNGLTATANGETSITVQPGETATMAVTASCTSGELSYQWWKEVHHTENGNDYWKWDAIAGATEATYTTEALYKAENYYCRITDTYGNSTEVYFYTRIENGLTATANGETSINVQPGETATMAVTASCTTGELSYQWSQYVHHTENGNDYWGWETIAGATEATYTTEALYNAGRYLCQVADSYGNGTNVEFYISIENGLTATANGETDINVQPGEAATMAVTASCTTGELSYQWWQYIHNTENGNDDWRWETIAGATEATYTTEALYKAENYYCRITDSYGNSTEVWFYIQIDNELTAEAADGENSFAVRPGEAATMAVTASCTTGELSYQWSKYVHHTENGNDYWGWIEIAGAAEATYTTEALNKAENYDCRITDSYGNSTNVGFYIRVDNDLTAEAADGENSFAVRPGETANLAVEASCYSGTLTYRWYQYADDPENGAQWEIIDNATGSSYTTGPVNGHVDYYCNVSDEYGNSTDVWFYIRVDNELTAEAADGETSFAVHAGETANLAVEASCYSGTLTYRWYQYADDPENGAQWEIIDNATGSSYTTGPVNGHVNYYCNVRDEYGNSTDIWFYIQIDNELEVIPVGARIKRVELGENVALAVTADCLAGTVTYQWYKEWQPIDNATSESYTVQNVSEPGYYECEVTDEYGGTANTSFEIRINNEISAEHGGNGNSVYYVPMGNTVTLNVIASTKYGEIHYQWYKWHMYEENGSWYYGESEEISGATEATYTTEAIYERQTEYYCNVNDDYGSGMSISFNVYADTGLTAEPADKDVFQTNEAPITMAVTVSSNFPDDEIRYQWYSRNYGEIYGETENAYTLTNPEAGAYYCDVYDGTKSERVWFYIAEGTYADAFGETIFDVDPGTQVTARVIAGNAENDITYEWYEVGKEAPIAGVTEPVYTFEANRDQQIYCHVTGTDIENFIWFYININSSWHEDKEGISKINIIPAGGSVQLRCTITNNADNTLTYEWTKDGETLEDETGNTLTVTEGGYYCCTAINMFGTIFVSSYYCLEGEPETLTAGRKVNGQESGTSIYQIVPGKTGMYELEAEGWVGLYRAGQYDCQVSMGNETRYSRLEAGQTYYAVLEGSYASFKYTLDIEEKTELTISLQKGQTLRIPDLYRNDRWISFDHAWSSDKSVIRTDWNRMVLRQEGTADVTVIYDNDTQIVYHINVVTGNTLVLPEQLVTIEEDAFNGDASAKFVKLGYNVQSVKRGAFANTGNICLTVENDYTEFEAGVFSHSNPVIICNDGHVAWYCRNNGIPFFCFE